MKKKLENKASCFLIIILIWGVSLNKTLGQSPNNNPTENFVYEEISAVKEVTFYSPTYPNTDGWVRMKNDDNTPVSNEINKTVAWDSTSTKPVTFISGNTGQVSAKFILENCNLNFDPEIIFIRGINNNGFNLPPAEAIKSNGCIEYPRNNLELAFADNTVNYFEEFGIIWYAAPAIDTPIEDWVSIGESKHEIYILFDVPDILYGGGQVGFTEPFHTVIHLGCVSAKGLSDSIAIVDAIYSEFMDQDVRKYGSNSPLTYWGGSNPFDVNNPICRTTQGFLQYEDGRCQEWAFFFNDLLKMQGIKGADIVTVDWNYILNGSDSTMMVADIFGFFGNQTSNISVTSFISPYTNDPGYLAVFLVKDWVISGSDAFVVSSFDSLSQDITLNNGNIIPCKDELGVGGQGVDDPPSEFWSHAFVKFNNFYYDPSYGTPKASSQVDWEQSSLDAFAGRLTLSVIENNIEITRRILWLARLNPPGLQVNFVIQP